MLATTALALVALVAAAGGAAATNTPSPSHRAATQAGPTSCT